MAGCAVIVAGFGFRAAATLQSLSDALQRAGGQGRATALATAEDKSKSGAFCALAQTQNARIVAIDAATLARQETVTRSGASLAARGIGSLAEAAALAGAGPGARLITPRVVSGDGMATCALAERDET